MFVSWSFCNEQWLRFICLAWISNPSTTSMKLAFVFFFFIVTQLKHLRPKLIKPPRSKSVREAKVGFKLEEFTQIERVTRSGFRP